MTKNNKDSKLNAAREMDVLRKHYIQAVGRGIRHKSEAYILTQLLYKRTNAEVIRLICHATLEYNNVSITPPQFAKYLMYLFLPRNNREAILGDLEEDFHEVHKKFGLWKAKFHYWFQVLRSIWPMIGGLIGKLIILSIKRLKATI